MKPFRIAEEARDDLASIWEYIALENDAPEAADKIMDGLEGVFRQLGKHPLIGPRRPEFGPELRSFPQGNYVVLYRPTPENVEIVRVLHGARDVQAICGAPENGAGAFTSSFARSQCRSRKREVKGPASCFSGPLPKLKMLGGVCGPLG